MRPLARLIALAIVFVLRRRLPPPQGRPPRIVASGPPDARAELLLLVLLGGVAACGVGFIVVYALDRLGSQTQLLGIALGLGLLLLAAAFLVVASRLVVTEEVDEPYPQPSPPDQAAVAQIVTESGERFRRRRLLGLAAGAAGGSIGLALVVPALSLGPALDTDVFLRTPWRRGRRLVDENGRPLRADDIEQLTFYTAYPEGAEREQLGAPLVVIRMAPALLHLPAGRGTWAPDGILAYSKICTHAGCAVALYRAPLFPPVEPAPALVCPCHYSTFDPASGGTVLFGPAGRDLPQLPLLIDAAGDLRAGGTFSGPVGPSWWDVRRERPQP